MRKIVNISNKIWKNSLPFYKFCFHLLLIFILLKGLFFCYNYDVLVYRSANEFTFWQTLHILLFSLLYDTIIVVYINIPFLIFLQLASFLSSQFFKYAVLLIFFGTNLLAVWLNMIDVLYYRFHLQKANADLSFVIDHFFAQFFHQSALTIAICFLVFIFIFLVVLKLHLSFCKSLSSVSNGKFIAVAAIIISGIVFLIPNFRSACINIARPTYPLIYINSRQLVIVENSFHTFIYSLAQDGKVIASTKYFPDVICDSLMPVKKVFPQPIETNNSKNIVLFIMESVSLDYFIKENRYHAELPFFDSILQKSLFFPNAFSYGLYSNVGITAILASVPTTMDVPLYHSPFITMPITQVGAALKKSGYHSFFCIGDDYDNFGFAKCTNWVGIDKYYCKDDIPESNQLLFHTMGLHDEFTLDFMHQKINSLAPPFFAVNFNISTHYPNDLPATFKKKFPENYTLPMRGIGYYDSALHSFFNAAQKETWFKNTVFIFCSDHWMYPDNKVANFHSINSYRIPIIIYEPAASRMQIDTSLVSQFDILGTVLSIGKYTDTAISYGGNLLDSSSIVNRKVVTRLNGNLYQVIDDAYVLGFNVASNKSEFLYHYKYDKNLSNNLIEEEEMRDKRNELRKYLQAFLQKAATQRSGQYFK